MPTTTRPTTAWPLPASRSRRPAAVLAACLVMAGGLGALTPSLAQPAAATASFNVPAGPLAEALTRFAQQAGVALALDASRVQGLRTAGLQGTHSVEQGFAQLLGGTGLVAQRGPAGYTLAPASAPAAPAAPAQSGAANAADAPTLATVNVLADGERSAVTEGTGSYTTRETSTATRLALTPRETPQSVSVITRQRIEDQALTQLTDVITQTPGLIINQGGNLGSDSSPIYSRGFGVDTYMVDGVRQLNSNYTDIFQTQDMAIVDRIEVLRGASGLINGVGTPGGAINIVRKRPTQTFQATVRGELGSWNLRRAEADISTPFNESASVRGRLVAAVQRNDAYIDRLKEERDVLYGVVEADVTRDTRVHAGLSWQRFEASGHARGGLPAFYSDGTRTRWAVSDSAAAVWGHSYRHYGSLFGGVDHQFSPDWHLKVKVSRDFTEYDEMNGYASGGYPDRWTGAGVNLWAGPWTSDPRQDTIDVQLNGRFEALGRKHDLVFGAQAARSTYGTYGYPLWTIPGWNDSIPNIFLWNGHVPAEPPSIPSSSIRSDERMNSAFGVLRFKPADSLALIVGARVTDWSRTQDTTTFSTGSTTYLDRRERGQVTPFAGLTWDFARDWSAYASYTDIFKPQNNKLLSGEYIDPQTGASYELGVKGSLLNDRLNVSAAIYKAKQDNLAVALVPTVRLSDGSTAYEAKSGTSTRGFELEASGEVRPGWQVAASFARNMTRDRDGKRLLTNVPQNTFKLATSYRIANVGHGLTVGGAVRWQSEIYSDYTLPVVGTRRFTQESYAVADLMARYAITPRLSATLNVKNVFDKRYYAATGTAYYGTPREFRVGLDARF